MKSFPPLLVPLLLSYVPVFILLILCTSLATDNNKILIDLSQEKNTTRVVFPYMAEDHVDFIKITVRGKEESARNLASHFSMEFNAERPPHDWKMLRWGKKMVKEYEALEFVSIEMESFEYPSDVKVTITPEDDDGRD